MTIPEQIETARQDLQQRMDALLADGAECLVKDGETLVTSFYIAGFELLLPQPFFDRQSGELSGLSWWCWFREIHFEGGMERSHLLHVKAFDWLNDRNLTLATDDYILLICSLDPPDIDPQGNAIWAEWQKFKQENPWLEDVAFDLRSAFLETARRAVG